MKGVAMLVLTGAMLAFPVKAENTRTQAIGGNWEFRQARCNDWYPATVPGTVHTDLMACGLIPDPYFGLNERCVQWVDKEDWVYRTSFDIDDGMYGMRHLELVFEGLDTYADVYLNGTKVISADNMFIEWSAPVRDLIKKGGNELEVHFFSPVKTDLAKYDALPYTYPAINDQSQNGGLFDRQVSIFARKAGYHYGWDWGPRLVTSGIWRPVILRGWNDMRISDIHYDQKSVTSRKADIVARVEILSDRDLNGAEITVTADGKTVAKTGKDLKEGTNCIEIPFSMKNPKLWWTRELGTPYLYGFSLTVSEGGKAIASRTDEIGIRSIKVVNEEVADGKTFYFELNGVPVFMKGANYIPCDVFLPRVTKEIYDRTIADAVAVNMNMLRVWGGGVYEDDYFYELCDRNGIMIWQDFMFACSMYPVEGRLEESITAEAEYNIRRLRNHPCIALWCGNNECNDAWHGWGWDKRYTKQGHPEYDEIIGKQFDRLYYGILPEAVERFAPGAAYRPSSPWAGRGIVSDGSMGDTHYWNVWHGKAPIATYNTTRSRFFSEYGFQSFPGIETIKTFAPDTSSWRIDSDVMMSHQRGGEFANMRIAQYMEDEYWKPSGFEDFIYMSQVLQGDAIRTAIEAHRRDKPYCWGSLFWQHNDCWPVASWSSRDWYGCWKAQHYYSKAAFADILVSPVTDGRTARVSIVSDRLSKVSGVLDVKIMDVYGNAVASYSRNVVLPGNSSEVYLETELPEDAVPEECVLSASFSENSGKYESIVPFSLLKDMTLPECRLETSVVQVDGGFEVTVSSDNYARAVWLTIDGVSHHFSDNFFDLLPGMSKSVTIKTDLTEKEFGKQLRIRSLDRTRPVSLTIDTESVTNDGYIGNGVQWDPYSLDYGKGKVEISDSDWEKIYARLDYMRPSFIRMMQNTSSRMMDGKLDPNIGFDHLSHLLDWCQSRGVTVMFGDWGGQMVDSKNKVINRGLICHAAEYVKFLVEEKGFDCIRYYNLINEPNGYWSVTDGDFDLWRESVRILHDEFVRFGIDRKVAVVGPDTAIWSDNESWWIGRTDEELGDRIGLYDIHTYPSKSTINSKEYAEIISAYKNAVPEGKKIVMGEIGIKFVSDADSLYNKENIRRAEACPFASKSDSQMFVYDTIYGVDMADALFQTINAGYSGSIVWMLDDAMHTHETRDRLKIWGFWNIMGDEYFGPEQENVRPWFYAWSLLCRYIPAGSSFNKVETGISGVGAVSAIHGDKRTVAIVNVTDSDRSVFVRSTSESVIDGAQMYRYGEGLYKTSGDHVMVPEAENVDFDLSSGFMLEVPAESMVVISNMD